MGPLFRLTITVQNTSPSTAIIDHYITFKCDYSLYRLNKPRIEVTTPTDAGSYFTFPPSLPSQLPLLVPSLSYNFECMVECLDEMGRTGSIDVFVLRKGNPVPLITALINMPVSEIMVMS